MRKCQLAIISACPNDVDKCEHGFIHDPCLVSQHLGCKCQCVEWDEILDEVAEEVIADIKKDSYEEGFESGESAGYDAGHDSGYDSGYEKGKEDGYAECQEDQE